MRKPRGVVRKARIVDPFLVPKMAAQIGPPAFVEQAQVDPAPVAGPVKVDQRIARFAGRASWPALDPRLAAMVACDIR